MRYVIVVVSVTLFVLWEVMYDNWAVTKAVVAEVRRVLYMIGL